MLHVTLGERSIVNDYQASACIVMRLPRGMGAGPDLGTSTAANQFFVEGSYADIPAKPFPHRNASDHRCY